MQYKAYALTKPLQVFSELEIKNAVTGRRFPSFNATVANTAAVTALPVTDDFRASLYLDYDWKREHIAPGATGNGFVANAERFRITLRLSKDF